MRVIHPTLPTASAGVARGASTRRPLRRGPTRRTECRAHLPRILLADDDIEMRRLIAISLRRDGYEVIEADGGTELLDALASDLLHPVGQPPFALIIADFHMPGATGLSVLAGLRGSDWVVPFILITAFGGAAFRAKALREGASAVFDKPFDMEDLRAAVRQLAASGMARGARP